MKKFTLLLSSALLLTALAAEGADLCSEPAKTGQGSFVGFTDPARAACVYRGIPFAEPPTGARRLKRPEPPAPHEGIVEATKFGPACLQNESILNGGKAEAYSEDCLYLNVWRPAKSGKYPVMVWIYGGGFVGGSGSFDIYDGAHLASRQDVVVVTFNYRLGAFGFLALPELKAEDAKGSTGNYGILDEVRALEWVRDNIAAFGGDPNNVTVFGQSAGAMSVCVLLVSPEAKGLFQKAMMMSGPCRLMTKLEDGYAHGRDYAKAMGCEGKDVLSCLRAKPAAAFSLKGGNDLFSGGTTWAPTIDGAVLPDLPVKMIQAGQYQKVPVIISSTRDELRDYTMVIPGLGLWPRAVVKGLMKQLTGPNFSDLMSLYNFHDFRRPIDVAFAFGNQMTFDTPLFMMAEAMSGQNPVHIYRMDFDRTRFPHKMGAFHAIDVPFVFGALNADVTLAKLLVSKKAYDKYGYLGYTMMDYVTNFAKTGDPNDGKNPAWPAYTKADRERLYFNVKITAQPLTEKELARYRWYETRDMKDILNGKLSQRLKK